MRLKSLVALIGASVVTAALAGTGAHADPDVGGSQDGPTTRVTVRGTGVKGGASNGGYTMPSPCWYERSDTTPSKWLDDGQRQDPGANQNPEEYEKQFKKGKKGKGSWWNLASADSAAGDACRAGRDLWFFQPDGDAPPPAAIDLEQLAMIARAALTVPQPNVRVNPTNKSFVNMDTWVWATGIEETRLWVTASIDTLSVTVTATLQDLEIEPGTSADRARVKENCGPIGYKYGKGKPFRCGVTYLRSAADQPGEAYTLSAITTWNIDVEPAMDLGFDPIVLTDEEEVPVDEVQAVTE